jgi:gas vesicle protein
MSEQKDDLVFLAGLVVGAIVGGMAAVLLAPKSGQDLREQVAERGLELKNRAEETVQRAQHVASEAVAKVRTTAEELIARPGEDTVSGGGGI